MSDEAFPLITTLHEHDYVLVMVDPDTREARTGKITIADFLNAVQVAAPARAQASAVVSANLQSSLAWYWSMDEVNGTRYESIGGGNHLLERNIDGSATVTIPSVAGRQDRGLAADFSTVSSPTTQRYLSVALPEFGNNRLAINCHVKVGDPGEIVGGTQNGYPIWTMIPQQPSRRGSWTGGFFFSLGFEKVDADYRFTARMAYLNSNGTITHTVHLVGSTAISFNTFYQVLVYTTPVGTDPTKVTLNMSINNVVTAGTEVSYIASAQTMFYIAENPVSYGYQGVPVGLVVDNISLWNGHTFSDYHLESLFNGGRGWDPTHPILDKCIMFWELDENSGSTRLDSQGRFPLVEADGAVGRAAGQFGFAADFIASATNYLATTRTFPLSVQGMSFAGFVFMDDVVATQALFGWLVESAGDHRGIRIYYKSDLGFVFQVGDGTGTLKTVNNLHGGAIAPGAWYFVVCTLEGGELVISVNGGAPVFGLTDAFPADHGGLLMMGRDHGGAGNILPLNGRMDAWGIYSPPLTADEQDQLLTQVSYPF